MKSFFDTSTLVKLYFSEADSLKIESYVEQYTPEVVLSELAKIEFRSAVWRKIRMNDIGEHEGNRVISYFDADVPNYLWISLNRNILKSAQRLLMNYGSQGLRTLDSIQLASALQVRHENCVYFAADKVLNSLFHEEQLPVIDLSQL